MCSIILYEFKEPLEGVRKQDRSYGQAENEALDTFYGHVGKESRKELTEAEAEALDGVMATLQEAYAVDESGVGIRYHRVRHASERHPNHSFSVGHFRSSYTGKGLDNILRDRIGIDLDDIFDHKGLGHFHKPDWAVSLVRARKALEDFTTYIARNGPIEVFEVSYNPFKILEDDQVTSRADALKLFEAERGRTKQESYINEKGKFFPEGITVLGVIEGRSITGKEAQYLIYKSDLDTYVQALDVVIETCEWVLEQDNGSEFVLGFNH